MPSLTSSPSPSPPPPPPPPPQPTPPQSPPAMPRKNSHRPLAAKAPRGLAPSTPTAHSAPPSAPGTPAPAPPKAEPKKIPSTRSRPSVAGKTLIEKPRVGKVASKALASKLSVKAEKAAEKAAERAAESAALAAERLALENVIEQSMAALQREVHVIERDISSMEEDYIKSTWAQGNVLRGWDGFGRRLDRSERAVTGNGSGVATGAPKHRKSRLSDRIFSLSSSTSPFRIENPDVQIGKRGGVQKKKKKR
ncbi:unnamed protein product [Agarophyton chilense]